MEQTALLCIFVFQLFAEWGVRRDWQGDPLNAWMICNHVTKVKGMFLLNGHLRHKALRHPSKMIMFVRLPVVACHDL